MFQKIQEQDWFQNKLVLFFITVVFLFWMKSYFALRFSFELDIENKMQEFILFITPLSSALLFFGLALYAGEKRQKRAIVMIHFVLSFILYANVVYYRFFDDFITIPVLFQFKNFSDLGGSAKNLMSGTDLLYFIDFLIVLGISMVQKRFPEKKPNKKTVAIVFASGLTLLSINIGLAEAQRPQLLTRTFDRLMLVKLLGIYNYHIYDAVMSTKSSAQRTFANSNELAEVQNYVYSEKKAPNNEYFGIAKNKNVVLVSMESLQNFVINRRVNGQEVTPFLNNLIHNSFYFENFYHNTGQGKTSDAEFMVDNSLYGLPRGAVFTTNAGNEYNATPEILSKYGYTAVSLHGNNKSFWNRDLMYQALGYDQFFSQEYYEVTEENSVNYGLKDIPFFEQSMPLLKGLNQPFYAKFLTLTNHYPYVLNSEEDEMIAPTETGDASVDRYFQTVRYLDESLKQFFDHMKKNGLYENTVFVLYGDHYGISSNHNEAMSEILSTEIRPFEHIQLQEVPLIIHIPGMEGEIMETVSGQVDIKPTILHLLGIEEPNDIQFGTDLFAADRESYTVQRDGSFITDKVVYSSEQNICYDKTLGIEIDFASCEPYIEKTRTELEMSDKVVYSDLLRFIGEQHQEKQLKK
jgi:lipoteichoic acid synthase